jgi:cobalt-precorrin 5A hydrolase
MATHDADHTMGGGKGMIEQLAIGIGCSSKANVEDVLRLVNQCLPEIDCPRVIATLESRAAMGNAIASALSLQLVLFPAETLAHVAFETPSSIALERAGTASVAEASALAALGASARLLVPRQTGRFCTCAVAGRP